MFLKLPSRIPKWKWVGEARRSGFRLPQSSFPPQHGTATQRQPSEVRYRFAHLPFSHILQSLNSHRFSFCSVSFLFNNPRPFILKLHIRKTHLCFPMPVNCCQKCVNSRPDLSWSPIIIIWSPLVIIIIMWVIAVFILRCVCCTVTRKSGHIQTGVLPLGILCYFVERHHWPKRVIGSKQLTATDFEIMRLSWVTLAYFW